MLNIGVIFGGRSGEHEVSLMSSTSILKVMDKTKYNILPIGIDKAGEWYIFKGDYDKIINNTWKDEAIKAYFPADSNFKGIFAIENGKLLKFPLDIVFPVLHGPNGEDGTMQGLFELANIPYVSCGVLGSSIAMDKIYAKYLLERAGIPVARYKTVIRHELENDTDNMLNLLEAFFTYPVFVKPANLGSSVGITKVYNRSELLSALKLAAKYDRKILVEEFINGREIECSVLGNESPQASLPGEIIPCHEFYDYNAKYFDDGKSRIVIPAPISSEKTEEIRTLAIKAYKTLDCSIYSRVDFFIQKGTGKVYVNELNTIPGFTKISMYPKMWEATGLPYAKLIDRLIELSLERYADSKKER
jgi:D-alanine-D-alanine ligase